MHVIEFLRNCFAMAKNRASREEKKEEFAMDIIAIESAGIREELRKIQLDAHETCLEVGASRHALECICRELKRLNEFLREPKSFEIREENSMATSGLAIVVGTTRTFDLADVPSNAVLPAGVVPTWTSDDSANTTLTPSTDGLKCNVAVSASAPVPGGFNLTVSAALPDGTNPTSGPQPVAYQSAPVIEPTSFTISEEPAS